MSDQTEPILLTSRIASLAVGASKTVDDIDALKNPDKRPIFIDEVRFSLLNTARDTLVDPGMLGSIYLDLKLGRLPLTNGEVPLWLVDVTKNLYAFDRLSYVTWKFPKPLIVNPGVILMPTLRQIPSQFVSQAAVSVDITLVGRVIPNDQQMPEESDVPYASAFIGANVAMNADLRESSTERNLANVTSRLLNVTHLTGRALFTAAGFGGLFADANIESPDVTIKYVDLQIVNDQNEQIIRDRSRWGAIFPTPTGAWPMRSTLAPKSFYLARINAAYATYAQAARKAQLQLALLGYRRELLPTR